MGRSINNDDSRRQTCKRIGAILLLGGLAVLIGRSVYLHSASRPQMAVVETSGWGALFAMGVGCVFQTKWLVRRLSPAVLVIIGVLLAMICAAFVREIAG